MSLSLRSYATPCLRYAMAARTRAVSSRAFSQSRAVRAKKEEEDDEGDSGDEAEDKKSQRRGRRGPFRGPGTKYEDPAFVQWLRTDGEKFRKVTPEGRQYLGGLQTPFPLNPTFKPPMPMPDATRTQLYLDYMRDNLTIREISRKYNISLRRVEACIRLKHVEFEMRMEGRMPETAFTTVMERALGIEAVLQEKERRAQERAEEERLALQVEDAQTPVTLAGGHAAAVAQKLQEDRWPEEALEDIDADALSEEDRWQKKQEKLEEDEETNEEPYPFLADDKLADFMHDLADPKAPAAPYIKMYFEPVEEIVVCLTCWAWR
ncbi:eukaryotic mitochondrial regulator protein-domain-containing protein [Auriculariales sp. MPI-PUGE-AT-0066]|nr:eukaryotic mitochondrial regulator protein-domain-containing protein [Auriculariales sp. MPI-PUGE-AT-0066]